MKGKLYIILAWATCTSLARSESLNPKRTSSQSLSRKSPIDGSTIAIPTKEQLDWQAKEIGMLIHYNIATYIDIDGCNNVPHLVPNITLFDPRDLDTEQWAQAIEGLGAQYATLVAKHNCGFATWPSKVNFETTDGHVVPYNYSIASSPARGHDVPSMLSQSMTKRGLGHGFYYSVNVNNFLDVQSNQVANGSAFAPGQVDPNLGPGQVSITQETYNKVVLAQLEELWSSYGNLTEIWFDGGYSSDQRENIQALLESHQPQAVIFNGCTVEGSCVSPNSVRWIGTESGEAPEENWSTGTINDGGDPDSPIFCPAECDTTLQTGDRWFYGVNQTLRSLDEMKQVYHETVGRNCVLELDLAPDRSGLVPPDQVTRLLELGDFIRQCYGQPCSSGRVDTSEKGVYHIEFEPAATLDRIQLREDQTNGQVIRTYGVYGRLTASPNAWTLLSNGTSIGNKKIDLLDQRYEITELMVNTTYVDTPVWKDVSVHLCR